MLKIRRPLGRLIFNMGIAIPGKTVFLIETAPRPCFNIKVVFPCIGINNYKIRWSWDFLIWTIAILKPVRYVWWVSCAGKTASLCWMRTQCHLNIKTRADSISLPGLEFPLWRWDGHKIGLSPGRMGFPTRLYVYIKSGPCFPSWIYKCLYIVENDILVWELSCLKSLKTTGFWFNIKMPSYSWLRYEFLLL